MNGVFLGMMFLVSWQDSGPDLDPPTGPENPPALLRSMGINQDGQLVLVHYRTIHIGFEGYTYNSRSTEKVDLQDVRWMTVGGKRLTTDEVRERWGEGEQTILATAWGRPVGVEFRELFHPNVLVAVFPKRAPQWRKIEDPGRPLRS